MTGNHILIENLKGIKKLDFEIPKPGVHVITASNGSGKTTLMVCIERLKNTEAFGKHFIQQKSRNVDSYENTKITYLSKKGNSVTYTYRRISNSWRSLTRGIQAIKEFGYSNVITIPTLGKRVYTQSQIINGGKVRAASNSLREAMSEVLENEKFQKLLKLNLGEIRGRGGANRRNNTAFVLNAGVTRSGNKTTSTYYSESSFSLGEIFALNLLFELEIISTNSLLVIDELEVALHPRVQINLLKYIEKKAAEKNLTVLISTHSSSLIKCAKNLIFLEKSRLEEGVIVHYNCYPTLALQEVAVEEDIQPDYVFFVEDQNAEHLLKEMIKSYFKKNPAKRQPLWKILPIGGYPEVLRFTKNVNSYLLNKGIGQYAFLDNDVIEIRNNLQRKGNSRTEPESKLLLLFTEQLSRVKFLDITPELGIWNWMKTNPNKFQAALNLLYPDISVRVVDLFRHCNIAFPNISANPRDDAKNRINWLVNELYVKTNEDKKRIKQSFFMFYIEDYYSDTQNVNNLNSVFGPIFNRRGNI